MPSMTARYVEIYLSNNPPVPPTPQAPPKQTIDAVDAVAGDVLLVTFTKQSFNPPITSYRADGLSSGGKSATATILSTKPAAIQLTGLTVGELATVTLTAINSVGESPASDPVTATPIA